MKRTFTRRSHQRNGTNVAAHTVTREIPGPDAPTIAAPAASLAASDPISTPLHTPTSFVVQDDRLVVSDPCYESPEVVIDNVQPGEWTFDFERGTESRISSLYAYAPSSQGVRSPWEEAGDTGVDSGQAGIFASSAYRNDALFSPESERQFGDGEFYDACCEKTLGNEGLGTVPGGVVSSSGYGDGFYPVFVQRDQAGKAVAVRIDYMPEEDDLYDDDDDWFLDDEDEDDGEW